MITQNDKHSVKLIGISSATVATMAVALQPLVASSVLASSDADYSFTLTSDWQNCQQISSSYQAVYTFETASFYISICQQDNAYFYLGEAKQQEDSSIFIPADPLDNGSGFQAKNGNVSYLVLLPFAQQNNLTENPKPKEAILTIKRNDRLISVESSLNKYCRQSETTIVWDNIELEPHNSNQWANIPNARHTGLDFSLSEQGDRLLPTKVFDSNSQFDFYRLGGELYRLTTC